MKEYWKKYRKQLTWLGIITLVIIPLAIHTLFKIKAPCSFLDAEWEAGDVLAFYGVLIGAAATIAGVYLSIIAAQQSYHDDIINQSRPFMTMESRYFRRGTSTEDTHCATNPESNQAYRFEEFPLEKLYYVIENGSVEIKQQLTDKQQEYLNNGGIECIEYLPGVEAKRSVKMIYQPLEIENVGNGAAVSFSVGVNNAKLAETERKFPFARSLRVGGKFYISIYSENLDDKNYGDYIICISYYDILGNGYEQNYIYSIFEDENKSVAASLRMDGTQKKQLPKEQKSIQ